MAKMDYAKRNSEDLVQHNGWSKWNSNDSFTSVKWPYGNKYKGRLLENIPSSYYVWAIDNLVQLDESSEYCNYKLCEYLKDVLSERLRKKDYYKSERY